jgi:uncharacterized protein (DUF427 family)
MTIRILPEPRRVRVLLRGEVIAESREALRLEEGRYPPVYYFPRKDVKMERLARSAHRTVCPWKGDASYFSLPGAENAVWSYESPKEGVAAIREHLAFYPDKVDAIVAE